MRVQLALFEGDTLLERAEVIVSSSERTETHRVFRATHKLIGEAADIFLDNFAPQVSLKSAKLRMPIHISDDWETIALEKYTLAFRCHLDL